MNPKPKIVEKALVVYTDGSLYPKGRRGGYGMVFLYFDHVGEEHFIDDHHSIAVAGTTGNRMELQAVIDALKLAPSMDHFDEANSVVIRTDSLYVQSNYMKALGSWPNNNWRRYDGGRVENVELWKDFIRKYRKIQKRVEIQKVKAHGKGKDKDPHNDAADKLAKKAAKGALVDRTYRSSVRPKTSDKKTKKGNVRIEGQTMIIYVVEVEWLKTHKCWKYRYQVASKNHPDFDYLDFIYAPDIQLRDRHYYEVNVNDNPADPEIIELIREVEKEEILGDEKERS